MVITGKTSIILFLFHVFICHYKAFILLCNFEVKFYSVPPQIKPFLLSNYNCNVYISFGKKDIFINTLFQDTYQVPTLCQSLQTQQ